MNILTVDGGFCAPVHLRLLKRIEAQLPGFLEATGLFSGVSDGASVALYLSAKLGEGVPAPLAIDGAIAFSDELTACLRATPLGLLRGVCGWGSLMLVQPFQDVLRKWLGETTLGQLTRPVAIISFDLNDSRRKIFGMGDRLAPLDKDLPLYEVNWASGALPLWCPVYATSEGRYYSDGGLVDNNPAMAALVCALDHDESQRGDGPKRLDAIHLLSLGCADDEPIVRFADPDSWFDSLLNKVLGTYSPLLEPRRPGHTVQSRTWGWKQWMIPRVFSLVRLLIAARETGVDAECQQLLGRNYLRYAPPMPLIPSAIQIVFCSPKSTEEYYDKLATELATEPAFTALLTWISQIWMGNGAAAPAPTTPTG